MDNDIERSAPYAPANSVIAVIRRFRERGLPQPLNAQELTRVGVSEGNASRTLQALKWLGLIEDDGSASEVFVRLRRASTEEYPDLLGDVIRHAYHQVFQIIDPASATDVQIHDAFRYFRPEAQRARMVVLFTGLCKEAGILEGDVPEVRTSLRKSGTRSGSDARVVRKSKATHPLKQTAQDRIVVEQHALPEFQMVPSIARNGVTSNGYYGLLEGLLRQLPADHQWTARNRTRWLQAMTANVDLLVDVVESAERQPEQSMELTVHEDYREE